MTKPNAHDDHQLDGSLDVPTRRTVLLGAGGLGQAGGRSALVRTAAISRGDHSKGYTGVMVLGVDPSVVH